jgi:hypothetical protein
MKSTAKFLKNPASWDIAPFSGGYLVSDSGNNAIRLLKDGLVSTVVLADADKGDPFPVSPRGLLAEEAGLLVCDPFAGVVFSPFGMRLPFLDVSGGDWFFDAVSYMYGKGLMNGTSGTAFNPGKALTRGMLVTILARMHGAGVGGGRFAPDAEITRQDLATVILRYAEFAGEQFPVTLQYQNFTDEEKIADYAKNAVRTLYGGGIVTGRPSGKFDPKGKATRAEAATVLYRFAAKTE